ncbi:unnamed protein product [Phyllotreta striolata]|uniref:C2H2-type domain-containing protein n=1 Tax=Phyllotreta striolata TaxID=444603 RepID=A0A9N9TEH8_PHYSR|nr:unnamed protein product [Phyllotreta striolata]
MFNGVFSEKIIKQEKTDVPQELKSSSESCVNFNVKLENTDNNSVEDLPENVEIKSESLTDDTNHLEPLNISPKELNNISKELSKDCPFENETTVYKCPMCNKVFKKLQEHREHKKTHYIEKRTCKICKRVMQNYGKLQEHMNKHLGLKPFSCDECDKSFISVHYLKLHKKCHNPDATFKCPLCPKSFRTTSSLRCHQNVHAEKVEDYRCKVCSEQCNDAATYKTHILEHGKKAEIQCSLCKKAFYTDRGLEAHLSRHRELNFPCEYCGKIYPTMYKINRHIKRAHVANKCEECDEIFYDRSLYTKHKKQHSVEKPQECQYCQKVFEKAKNLSEHIRLQHKQDKEAQKCHVCGKEFINGALLKNHVKTHDKNFQCTHCDRVFSSRSNLEVHFVTHSGAKKYKCDLCGKHLCSKVSLKNHMASHSDERQYKCDVCEKTFKTNRRLYVHKMCHATEEKYQCEICLQKFRVKQYLKFHMNKHSKVKPFECDVCRKKFKHKKSRDKHVRSGKHKLVTDDEHDCDFCDETFASRKMLLEHFEGVHHKENVINSLDDCRDEDAVMEEVPV